MHPGEAGGHQNANAGKEDEELLARSTPVGDRPENRSGCSDQNATSR
jgi:hypothetical protein